jgi:hypothetical protein
VRGKSDVSSHHNEEFEWNENKMDPTTSFHPVRGINLGHKFLEIKGGISFQD